MLTFLGILTFACWATMMATMLMGNFTVMALAMAGIFICWLLIAAAVEAA